MSFIFYSKQLLVSLSTINVKIKQYIEFNEILKNENVKQCIVWVLSRCVII